MQPGDSSPTPHPAAELTALIDAVRRVEIAVTRLELTVRVVRHRRALALPHRRTPGAPVAVRQILAENKAEMAFGILAGLLALTFVLAVLITRTSA